MYLNQMLKAFFLSDWALVVLVLFLIAFVVTYCHCWQELRRQEVNDAHACAKPSEPFMMRRVIK